MAGPANHPGGAAWEPPLRSALWVRRIMGSPFTWFKPADPAREESEYRAFLESRLPQALDDLKAATENGSPASVQAGKGAVFVVAAGLATYGDLDRAILALDHVPDDHYIRPLAGTLPGFLPLPPELDPVRDPAAAAEWLRTHRARLRWVPGSHFELEVAG